MCEGVKKYGVKRSSNGRHKPSKHQHYSRVFRHFLCWVEKYRSHLQMCTLFTLTASGEKVTGAFKKRRHDKSAVWSVWASVVRVTCCSTTIIRKSAKLSKPSSLVWDSKMGFVAAVVFAVCCWFSHGVAGQEEPIQTFVIPHSHMDVGWVYTIQVGVFNPAKNLTCI